MKALVFGHQNISVMAPLPTLLSRAGFQVDVISHLADMRRCDHVDHLFLEKDIFKVVKSATKKSKADYDLIVPADDEMIGYVLNSKIADALKLRMLPVMSVENFEHLYSKIGLSRVLRRHGLKTPDFTVVEHEHDLAEAVRAFGTEVFLKIDASCGGFGVFACRDVEDIEKFRARLTYPLLIQQKIDGEVIDLSGFFQNSRLVFFQYAQMLESRPDAFGPSVLRRFQKLSSLGRPIYEQLNAVGRALGAHGFSNVTAIRAADGTLYFIEADLRPNVWVEYGKFFGEDPADDIRRYFNEGRYLEPEAFSANIDWADEAGAVVAPYTARLDAHEILQNKYDCQRFSLDYFHAAPPQPKVRRPGVKALIPQGWRNRLRRASA